MKAGFDRSVFEIIHTSAGGRPFQSDFLPEYYMKYYTAFVLFRYKSRFASAVLQPLSNLLSG